MYNRLNELLTHARECAVIGYTEGASQWMKDAVKYGAGIGKPVRPSLQKGIEAKARSNERHMKRTLAALDTEFRYR